MKIFQDDDLILSSFINLFGDDAETVEAYKKFRGLACDNELILQRYIRIEEK